MPCDPRNSITQAIAGSYAVYYLSPQEFSRGFDNGVLSYLGAIQADTLRITPSYSETGINTDFKGPDQPIDALLFPGDERLEFTLIEVNRNGVKRLIYPFSTVPSGLNLIDTPGRSGEGPQPGRLRSSYEGRLRLVPIGGNLRYWDSDLNFADLTTPNPSSPNIRDFFHVMIESDSGIVENYKAGLLELPITLRARSCRDSVTGQWRTHTYVSALSAPLS